MKKYLPGIFATVLAIVSSAFKASTVDPILNWDPSSITPSLVVDVSSYSSPEGPDCMGSTIPCKVDIAPYQNAADFVEFLKTNTSCRRQSIRSSGTGKRQFQGLIE